MTEDLALHIIASMHVVEGKLECKCEACEYTRKPIFAIDEKRIIHKTSVMESILNARNKQQTTGEN